MRIGLVGFEGSGKSTLFRALTGLRTEAGAKGRLRENMGVIKVPDERMIALTKLSESRRQVLAEVLFVDVAASGARHAESGPGPRALLANVIQAMREMDVLVLVLRGFTDAFGRTADPGGDLEAFRVELILNDLGPVERRVARLRKEGRPPSDAERSFLERCQAHLEDSRPLASLDMLPAQRQLLNGFGVLSTKSLLVVWNQAEAERDAPPTDSLRTVLQEERLLPLCAALEAEIAALPAAEQPDFLAAMGLERTARDHFVREAYALLDQICFFTTGPEESRAWPTPRGATARRAAGQIHSDLERGFIRAEVIHCAALLECGGEKAAREAGQIRSEGRDYIVQDGDVIHFRFHV